MAVYWLLHISQQKVCRDISFQAERLSISITVVVASQYFYTDLAEPNPAPLKYLLAMQKLIDSDEVRLPLVGISDGLKEKLGRNFVSA